MTYDMRGDAQVGRRITTISKADEVLYRRDSSRRPVKTAERVGAVGLGLYGVPRLGYVKDFADARSARGLRTGGAVQGVINAAMGARSGLINTTDHVLNRIPWPERVHSALRVVPSNVRPEAAVIAAAILEHKSRGKTKRTSYTPVRSR